MEGTTPPPGDKPVVPDTSPQEIKMVTINGRLDIDMLPAVMKEFQKDLDVAGLQSTKGVDTKKGYDTLGYGYAWISERLNQVVPFCWRIVTEDTETITETKSANGNIMHNVSIDVVLQLGNWRNFEHKDAEGNVRIYRSFEVLAESPVGQGWHKAMNLADGRKGALTNGFKKAAGFFGIGNEAYKKAIDEENQEVKDALNKKSKKAGKQVTPGNAANVAKNGNNLALIKRKLNEMGATTEPEAIRMLSEKYSFDCDSLDKLTDKQQKLLVQRILYPQQPNA